MPAKAEDKPYLTEDELREVADIIALLDSNNLSDVSMGDLPLFDVNGEQLGVITFTDGGRRFRQ